MAAALRSGFRSRGHNWWLLPQSGRSGTGVQGYVPVRTGLPLAIAAHPPSHALQLRRRLGLGFEPRADLSIPIVREDPGRLELINPIIPISVHPSLPYFKSYFTALLIKFLICPVSFLGGFALASFSTCSLLPTEQLEIDSASLYGVTIELTTQTIYWDTRLGSSPLAEGYVLSAPLAIFLHYQRSSP